MFGTSQLLETIITHSLSNQRKRFSASAIAGQSVIALSVFFAFLGMGFLIYATHLWLVNNYSPLAAAYYTGAISLGLAFLIGCIAFLGMKYRQTRIKKIRYEILDALRNATTQLDDEFGDSIRKNPKMAVLVASFMGFLFEDRIL